MSGFELKLSRVKLQLNQAELAKLLGYTQQGVSYMEKGTTIVPQAVEQKVRQVMRERGIQ